MNDRLKNISNKIANSKDFTFVKSIRFFTLLSVTDAYCKV